MSDCLLLPWLPPAARERGDCEVLKRRLSRLPLPSHRTSSQSLITSIRTQCKMRSSVLYAFILLSAVYARAIPVPEGRYSPFSGTSLRLISESQDPRLLEPSKLRQSPSFLRLKVCGYPHSKMAHY